MSGFVSAASLVAWPRVTQRWYAGFPHLLGSNGVLVLNTLYATPFIVGDSQSFDAIGLAGLGIASSKIRVGVYADSGGRPGALIVDGGQLDTSTSGIVSASVALQLSGRVWLAAVTQSTAGNTQRYATTTVQNPLLGAASFYAGGQAVGYSQGSISGALPDPWGTTFTEVTATNTCPIVYLRKT